MRENRTHGSEGRETGYSTGLPYPYPAATYDEYAERGESENRNKELKRGLSADRLSDHRYMANLYRPRGETAVFRVGRRW